MGDGVRRTASFSRCGVYRYALGRVWDDGGARLAMCLLNPSTADRERDDPTVRRCIGFARRWGYGSLEVVNIFALRSTDPGGLYSHAEPIGARNDGAIARAVGRADGVVLAWGHHGGLGGRGRAVESRVGSLAVARGLEVCCFGRTACDEPKHPLYLAGSTRARVMARGGVGGVGAERG